MGLVGVLVDVLVGTTVVAAVAVVVAVCGSGDGLAGTGECGKACGGWTGRGTDDRRALEVCRGAGWKLGL